MSLTNGCRFGEGECGVGSCFQRVQTGPHLTQDTLNLLMTSFYEGDQVKVRRLRSDDQWGTD